MKRTLLFITCMLVALTMSAQKGLAVGDVQKNSRLSETRGEEVNPMDSLYGEWLLMGWNDGGTWVEVDKKKVRTRNLSIEFKDNGFVTAYSMANDINFGQLTLKGNELHFDGDGVWSTMVYWDEMENFFFEEHIISIKSYRLDGKRLRLYYTDNDYFVFAKDLNDEEEQADYIPFVELGKQWHVVSNPTNPYVPCSFERYEMYDEVERDGKTYVQIRRIVDGKDTEGYDEVGLFREENRRVYKYEGGRDVMLYDFSLKEGDTFTYEYGVLGEPMNCKVMKQGWLEDGPQIEMLDSLTSEGAWTFKYRKLRTWTIGYDNGSGDYNEATTWIEGVGTLKNTFIRPYATGYVSYLAYIYRIDRPGDNDYLPFSLYNMYGPVYGSELPKGVPDYSEDWHEQFSYELNGDRLHVSGNVSLNCGGYYYAYFTEERTDDPMVRKLHFRIEEIGELTTCGNRYGTDFYVSGLNPNINYIIVDNQGEEHPVINKTPQDEYRPFVEDGKVWKVGDYSGNPVRRVEYYYFDGDTIIDGKTCKQMMRQRYVSPDHPDYAVISQLPSLSYMGAWYEENKKVYAYNSIYKQFNLMYDFSLDAYDTLQFNSQQYAIGPKQTGELKGFKGVYRDVWMRLDIDSIYSTTWLERVGGIDGPIVNVYYGKENHAMFLMSCTVGDELVYFNDEYEDGATPAGARKNRIDFSHTTKIKPKTRQEIKSRTRSEEEQSLYGEYNEQLLSINLDPINDAYMVSITDESGKVVYEKPINAGNIVGLNIDISAYSEGRYIVTVDNSNETFTGELNVITTGIEEVKSQKSEAKGYIYNLQGQRLNSLQKGLNIVNGRKVIVR